MLRLVLLTLGLLLTVQALPSAFHNAVFPENIAGVDSRIIGGNAALPGQIPFQASIRMITNVGSVGSCGASLVHSKWAMTAAHCTLGRTFVIVRLGVTDVTRPERILETTTWYDHPQYDSSTLNHDITLIDLGRDVEFTDKIQPIRIQRADEVDNRYVDRVAIASGFGRTVDGGSASETLNYVPLRIISNEACAAVYGIIIDSTICAVGIGHFSHSTCNGDSGGPLALVEGSENVLVGVVSFVSSRGCASDSPSGYVRPGYYHDWFTEVSGIDFNQPINSTAK